MSCLCPPSIQGKNWIQIQASPGTCPYFERINQLWQGSGLKRWEGKGDIMFLEVPW